MKSWCCEVFYNNDSPERDSDDSLASGWTSGMRDGFAEIPSAQGGLIDGGRGSNHFGANSGRIWPRQTSGRNSEGKFRPNLGTTGWIRQILADGGRARTGPCFTLGHDDPTHTHKQLDNLRSVAGKLRVQLADFGGPAGPKLMPSEVGGN